MPNQLQVTLSDEIAAGELVIYAENDADIYRDPCESAEAFQTRRI